MDECDEDQNSNGYLEDRLALPVPCLYLKTNQLMSFWLLDVRLVAFCITHRRLDSSNTSGIKVITPIRPILCLGQQMDVNEATLRLM